MFKRIKSYYFNRFREETGQALIIVLAVLMIGGLTLPPVLSQVGNALNTGQVYNSKTDELYAADSGIEDAIWQIRYDRLEVIFSEPAFDDYDYSTVWEYSLSEPINDLIADVTLQNIWLLKDVATPSPTQARDIIESNKLIVAGTAVDNENYKIKLSFYPGEDEEEALWVDSLGIWLPHGFHYDGTCNLEEDGEDPYYSVPSVSDHAGGEAVIWDFSSVPFLDFPGEIESSDMPQCTEITFKYTADIPGARPVTISWIESSWDPESGISQVISPSWDIDTKVYRVISTAGDTEIEAYPSRCELRKMSAAIAGDYTAIGNSLMIDGGGDSSIRDDLLPFSSTTVSDVPNDAGEGYADVVSAYLYWTGWRSEGSKQTELYDDCANFGKWISGSCWNIDPGHFRSHFSSGIDETRYLTLKDNESLDLSAYDAGTVVVSWEYWETGILEGEGEYMDGLDFAFSGDGGDTWSDNIEVFRNDVGSSEKTYYYIIPEEYLTDDFKFRYYLVGFGESDDDWCYLDNIRVSVMPPDDDAEFKIDGIQVFFDGEGEPDTGDGDIESGRTQVLPNFDSDGDPNGFSYACYLDVTRLVEEYAEIIEDEFEVEHRTGNGIYTVGDVEADTGNMWSYAGWSLIIIYSSPETAGHQLYLYDDFMYADEYTNIDFDDDGEPGGTITGFVVPEQIGEQPNAAKMTCFVGEGDSYTGDTLKFTGQSMAYKYLFNGSSPWNNVWNSQSPGASYDGIDIDTFNVPWYDPLEPGDTSALIELETDSDSWNLVYIILSMTSETVTGGTVHYMIR